MMYELLVALVEIKCDYLLTTNYYETDKPLEFRFIHPSTLIKAPWSENLAKTPVCAVDDDDVFSIPDAGFKIRLNEKNVENALQQAINYKLVVNDIPCEKSEYIDNFWKEVGK